MGFRLAVYTRLFRIVWREKWRDKCGFRQVVFLKVYYVEVFWERKIAWEFFGGLWRSGIEQKWSILRTQFYVKITWARFGETFSEKVFFIEKSALSVSFACHFEVWVVPELIIWIFLVFLGNYVSFIHQSCQFHSYFLILLSHISKILISSSFSATW